MAYPTVWWPISQALMSPSLKIYVFLQLYRVHTWSREQPCQSVSLAMSTLFLPHWTCWNHTNVPDILCGLQDVPRCEADVMQHCTGGGEGDKDVVDLQSLEELQHAEGLLCNGTGLGMMLVEASLHPPFQLFSIWGDDGHRSFNAGVATINQYKVPCRERGNNTLVTIMHCN